MGNGGEPWRRRHARVHGQECLYSRQGCASLPMIHPPQGYNVHLNYSCWPLFPPRPDFLSVLPLGNTGVTATAPCGGRRTITRRKAPWNERRPYEPKPSSVPTAGKYSQFPDGRRTNMKPLWTMTRSVACGPMLL